MIRIFNQYVSLKLLLLGGVEALLTFLALLCGAKLRFWGDPSQFSEYTALPAFGLQTGVFVLMFQICFYYCDLYDHSVAGKPGRQAVALVESLGAGFLLLGLTYYIFPKLLIGRGVLFISTSLLGGFVALSRCALDKLCAAAFEERVVILGAGELAGKVALEMLRRKDLAIALAGFIDHGPWQPGREFLGYPILGCVEDLEKVAAEWSDYCVQHCRINHIRVEKKQHQSDQHKLAHGNSGSTSRLITRVTGSGKFCHTRIAG
jgi:FlaA1/EpsC-like NDP-sugar epimerase